MVDVPKSQLGHRSDIEQYAMLKRCSDKQDMTECNEWRNNNHQEGVWLQGADFKGWYLDILPPVLRPHRHIAPKNHIAAQGHQE